MRRLAEYNEKQRAERAARAFEKESRIKQRVQVGLPGVARPQLTCQAFEALEQNRSYRRN